MIKSSVKPLQPQSSTRSSFQMSQQSAEGFGHCSAALQVRLQAYLGTHYTLLESDLAALPPNLNLSPETQSQLYFTIREAMQKAVSQATEAATTLFTNAAILEAETAVHPGTTSSQNNVGTNIDIGGELRSDEHEVQLQSQEAPTSVPLQAPESASPTPAQVPLPASPRKRSIDMVEMVEDDHSHGGYLPRQRKALKTRAHQDARKQMRSQEQVEYAKEQARKARTRQLRRWNGISAYRRRQQYLVWILVHKQFNDKVGKFTDQDPSPDYKFMSSDEECFLQAGLASLECKGSLRASNINSVGRTCDHSGSQNEVTASGIEIVRHIFDPTGGQHDVIVSLSPVPDPATLIPPTTERTQGMVGVEENDTAPSSNFVLGSPIQESATMEDVQIQPPSSTVSTLASPQTPDSTFSDARNGYSTEDTEMSGDEGQVKFGSQNSNSLLNTSSTGTVLAMNIFQSTSDPEMTDAPNARTVPVLNTPTALVGDAQMDEVQEETPLVVTGRSSDTSMQEAQATAEQPSAFHSAESASGIQVNTSMDHSSEMSDRATIGTINQATSSENMGESSNVQPQSAFSIAVSTPTRGVKRSLEGSSLIVAADQGKKPKLASPSMISQTLTSHQSEVAQSPLLITSGVSFQTSQLFDCIEKSALMAAKDMIAESDDGNRSTLRMCLIQFTATHPGLNDQLRHDLTSLIDQKYPAVRSEIVTEPQTSEQAQEIPCVVQQHFECLEASAITAVENEDGLIDTDEGYPEAVRGNIKSAIESSAASDQLKRDVQFLTYQKYPLQFEGATGMMTDPQKQGKIPESPNVFDSPLRYAEWVLRWHPLLIPNVHKPLVRTLISEAEQIDPEIAWLKAMKTSPQLVGSLQDGLMAGHPNYKLRGQAAPGEDHQSWEYRELHSRTRLTLANEFSSIAKTDPEIYGQVLQHAFDMDLHPADCFRDEHRSGLSSETYDKIMKFVPALDNVRLDDYFAQEHCGATLTEKQRESLPKDVGGTADDLVERLKHMGSLDILQEATELFFAAGNFAQRTNVFRRALRNAGLCTDLGNYAFRDFQSWLKTIELGSDQSDADTEADAGYVMDEDSQELQAQLYMELEYALQELLKLRYPRTQKSGATEALRPPLREAKGEYGAAEQKQEAKVSKGDAPKSSKGAIWKR